MARKPMAKTTVQSDNAVDAVEEQAEKKATTTTRAKKVKEFAPHDGIECRSVCAGGLNITCRSGNFYEFKDYGDTSLIEYQDLSALVRKRSEHIFTPRIIIDDEDFLNEFPQVKDFYDETYSVGDLKKILLLSPTAMKSAINELPESVYPTVRSLAATMVGNGEIDSLKTVKCLTDMFGADVNLLSELFSDK